MPSNNLYARLELLYLEPMQDSRPAAVPESQSRWQRWGQTLVNYFAGSQDPRITTRQDDEGRLYYEVYDPVVRSHYRFDSEQEVRVWLDERYYQ